MKARVCLKYFGNDCSFAESQKDLFKRPLFIMLVRWESITLVTSFTFFTETLCGPVIFLGFKPLIILLICHTLAALILKSLFSFGICSLISLMLG